MRTLQPQHRAALRDLLLGAIEHCEISRHLVGGIPHTFYHDDVKYAVPAFTFFGPPDNDAETRFVGVMAGRKAGDGLSAEVTLQLLERLLLQPGFASGLWLRILPVVNPLGLEHPDLLAPAHQPAIDRLQLECPDGVIEVATTNKSKLMIGLRSNWSGRDAAVHATEDIRRLGSELGDIEFGGLPATQLPFNASRTPWHLYVGLPANWSAVEATHIASQYLLAFFRRWQQQAVPALY